MRSRLVAAALAVAVWSAVGLCEVHGHDGQLNYKRPVAGQKGH